MLTPAHMIEREWPVIEKPLPPKRPNTPIPPRKEIARKQAINMRHWKPKPQKKEPEKY